MGRFEDRRTTVDQWSRPTPCDEWDVHALIDRMIVGAHHFALIARVEQMAHGWDLAASTGQDQAMPVDLAEAAFAFMEGQLPDAIRHPTGEGGAFKPVVPTADDATAQDKLIAYLGRQP